jgi:hypothetical protein
MIKILKKFDLDHLAQEMILAVNGILFLCAKKRREKKDSIPKIKKKLILN